LEQLQEACFRTTSYLDHFYSMHPGKLLGAKRLVVLVPSREGARPWKKWVRQVGAFAAIVWSGPGSAGSELQEM